MQCFTSLAIFVFRSSFRSNMIVITLAYFLSMLVFCVSGFCDMDATGAIPPSEADNVPVGQCKYWIDLHGWPYYLTNPNNCSQFWECTVAGDICLFECKHCNYPSLCPETGALYFDPTLQYPDGPACNWPSDIECTNPWVTTTTTTTTTTPACPLPCQQYVNGQCQPECCEDQDCTDPSKPLCNAAGLCQDGCRYITDCPGGQTICHEPWAHGDDNCEYCGNVNQDGIGECLPGCVNDPNLCPTDSFFICDNHICTDSGVKIIYKIRLITGTCVGCNQHEEGGAVIDVWGQQHPQSGIWLNCTTSYLDHRVIVDYENGHEAIFQSVVDNTQMGDCNNFAVRTRAATISWTGAGTWTPTDVAFLDTEGYASTCKLDGKGIASGQSVTVECPNV